MDTAELEHLAVSINERGVLQPIRVRRKGARFELIAGERRWRAARLAGLREIPALVVAADDRDSLLEGLIENIHREDLCAADRAQALLHLRQEMSAQSWEEVGRAIGVSRQHVHRLLSIMRLPESMREDPRAAELTEKHTRALHMLRSTPDGQLCLWERIHRDRLTGDEAIEFCGQLRKEASPSQTPRAPESSPREDRLATAISALTTALETASVSDLRDQRHRLRTLSRLLQDTVAKP
jgi:ParB family chromosome partitioning protein